MDVIRFIKKIEEVQFNLKTKGRGRFSAHSYHGICWAFEHSGRVSHKMKSGFHKLMQGDRHCFYFGMTNHEPNYQDRLIALDLFKEYAISEELYLKF